MDCALLSNADLSPKATGPPLVILPHISGHPSIRLSVPAAQGRPYPDPWLPDEQTVVPRRGLPCPTTQQETHNLRDSQPQPCPDGTAAPGPPLALRTPHTPTPGLWAAHPSPSPPGSYAIALPAACSAGPGSHPPHPTPNLPHGGEGGTGLQN